MTRTDIINGLIKKYQLRRYLEIGVDDVTRNFDKIECEYKAGIDPNVDCEYRMTSDEFFNSYTGVKFDLIFVDGEHTAKQALKDINNALNLITENGFVVVHDCNPTSEQMQRPLEQTGYINSDKILVLPHTGWSGDVWKAWAKLRTTRPDLGMYVVDVDFGIGIIKKRGFQKLFNRIIIPEYWFLDENRRELLNLRKTV